MNEETMTHVPPKHPLVRLLVHYGRIALSIAIAVAIFALIIPKFANYGSMLSTVGNLTVVQVFFVLGAMVCSMVTCWWQMQAALPGLTLAQAAVTNQTGTTISNIVPGGGMISLGVVMRMFRSWGFSRSDIGLEISTSGIWNTFMKLGLPITALALLAMTGRATAAQVLPALIGLFILIGVLLVFALVLWKEHFARTVGAALGSCSSPVRRLIRKPPVCGWDDRAARFRKNTIRLIQKRWLALTASTILSHLALFAVLIMSLRFIGVMPSQVTGVQVLAVFAFARLLSAAPITPGGVGVVELALIGGLYAAGRHHAGASLPVFKAQIAAAVLLFRTLTYGLQIPLGGFTYIIWRHNKSWRKEPAQMRIAEPPADIAEEQQQITDPDDAPRAASGG
jgi:uncharacterized membrane protein YbhN (UPF0104 family)